MASGGGSLHKKDWLKIGAGAALAATGLGAAGVGPMAGLFSTGAGAASAGAGGIAAGEALAGGGVAGMGAPMASMFGPSASGAAMLSSLAPAATPTLAEIGASAISGAPLAGLEATALAPVGTGAGLGSQGLFAGLGGTKAVKAGLKSAQVMSLMQKQQQAALAAPLSPPQRPQQQPTGSFTDALGKQDTMPPVGTPEYYEWMKRKYGL